MRRLLALLAVPALLAGCENDCDVICDKQLSCAGVTDEESAKLCRDQCLRDMEADRAADRFDECARCVEGESCEALTPEDGSAGACAEDCG